MRRFGVSSGLLVLLAAALAGAGAAPADRALELVEAYNARSFGNPGWRRVRLDLKSGETVTRSLTVANVWREEAGEVRTLFVLERPEGLKGTNYLLVEDSREPAGMRVSLFLPAGQRRVLTIQPSHFDEGLLGSDFSYRDMRMRILTVGYRFRVTGRIRVRGQDAWAVEAVPVSDEARRAESWGRSVYYLSATSPVLLGADHFQAASDDRPSKQMRVHGLRQIDGAWTETRMVMTASGGRSSVLTLEGFRAKVPGVGADLFLPEHLPAAAERLAALGLEAKPARGSP